MAITRRDVVDKREILEDGTIQARTARIIEEDGVIISKTFINRKVFHPGDDVSNEPDEVKRLAAVEHTPEKITAHQLRLAASEAAHRARIGEEE